MEDVLTRVGPRLRSLREARKLSLADVSASSGISVSTLSRLESGQRKPQLEFLLPLSQLYGLPLDDLVGAPEAGDPRVHLKPQHHGGHTMIPLSRVPTGIRAVKFVLHDKRPSRRGTQQSHEGYEWVYVLSGKLKLALGSKEFVLSAGEVVEFDTRTPHWFGQADAHPVEFLGLFGPQGERMHVKSA